MNNLPDNDAFTSQLVAVQRRLYAYILTILPNLADADDVLQETNAVLLRKRDEYEAGSEFGAWACRVAYFEVLALYKKRQRERKRVLFADQNMLDVLAGEAESRFAAGDQALLARLEKCIQKLNPLHRRLIRLRYGDNLLADEIAENLSRSSGAVRQLLYRIRMRLLECVKEIALAEEKS
ncbi:MAG: sigma-70 family RNA polymerase sigma factor [Pirellulales bacterium]|nr:sigma-70 family RNA polymerase sigma factor [Pirellulales bacterium]